MTSEDTPLPTTEESLRLISSMINKAKNRYSENGTLYLWWGWLILFCCLVQYAASQLFNTDFYYVWFLTWAMAILQFFIIRKKRRRAMAKTYTEEISGSIWIAFFICLMLCLFISMQFGQFQMIYPIILVLYGVPTFLSGIILQFRPLVFGGISCWILAAASPFIPPADQLLFVSIAVICAWIVPGYLLKRKFKKNM